MYRPNSARSNKYIAIVAVDFGTTYSGFAFAFNHKEGERGIHMSKAWGNDQGYNTFKTPTCILLNRDKEFIAFGYEAREKYADLEEAQDKEFYFFDRFKMTLHNEGDKVIDSRITLEARNGKRLLAVDVFAHALRFMKERALEILRERSGMEGGLNERDIQWVLTVPAIWQQASKQFMREAAYKAELVSEGNRDQLIIALEPEAASLHCRQRKMREFVDEMDDACVADVIARPLTDYMVVDNGGGTVDVTVHRIEKDDSVSEIHKATGGAWGGTKVEDNFEKLLVAIFGSEFVTKFKISHPSDWLTILTDIEMKKRSERPLKGETTRVRLTFNFILHYQNTFNDRSLQRITKESYHLDEVKLTNDYLCLGSEIMKRLFQPSIDSITAHMESLLEKPHCKNIKYVFLVGGFSESPLLQKAVKDKFSSRCRILIPEEAGLSVVKGAVMFGQKPESISRRICGMTYGCDVCRDFVDGVHKDEYKFETSDGEFNCNNLFKTLAQVNEEIRVGQVKTFTFNPLESSQSKVSFTFYITEKEDAMYVTDEGVRKEGTIITVSSPSIEKGTNREIELKIEFGGTEMKATAIDVETGNVRNTHIELITK
ncbi:heat shock 70 kDa protein 12A-like [Glandiceps talaboti]